MMRPRSRRFRSRLRSRRVQADCAPGRTGLDVTACTLLAVRYICSSGGDYGIPKVRVFLHFRKRSRI